MPRGTAHGKASIHDVARAAGVSVMSVSRSLRGVEGVSGPTRARVIQLAKELNYVPNSNARALVETNSTLIGISLPTLFNDVFADVLAGMRRTLSQAGYASVIDTTDYRPEAELRWADRVLGWRPAALVLTGGDHLDELRHRLVKDDVPTLEIWEAPDDPIDICVGIDHEQAGFDLARHVVSLGYRAPAFVGTHPGVDRRADQRISGLMRAFAGVEAYDLHRIGVEGSNAFVMGAEGVRGIGRDIRPDVVFFLNDHMAFGGMMALQAAGLNVCQDIGVVGFNALDLTTVLPFPITTMSTPRRQIGLVGGKNLLARLNGLRPDPVVRLPCKLVPGATTRHV